VLFKEAKMSFHKPGRVYEKHDAARAESWREEKKSIVYPYRLKSSVIDLSVLEVRDDEQKEDSGFNRAQRPDQTAQDGAGWPCSGPDQGRVING
jgi:hypothetical protein